MCGIKQPRPVWIVALSALAVIGCRQGMYDQARTKPLRPSSFFADGRSSRPLVDDTVPRGELRDDELLYTGRENGSLATRFPFPVTKAVIDRGHERFDIYCAACHDRVGNGNGMIVQRGFPRPPSYHSARLREAPVGHFFDVMTNGFGMMYPYADRITPRDRWAIIAYIRVLQRSQNARLADVPPEKRKELK